MEDCQGIQLFASSKRKPLSALQQDEKQQQKEKQANALSSQTNITQSAKRDPTQSFTQLGFSAWLIDTLAALSITQPTEIQSACIPAIFDGRDVLASAKTGSGKTAAFSLPILQKLNEDPFGIYALVLTPTRYPCITHQYPSVKPSNVSACMCLESWHIKLESKSRLLVKPFAFKSRSLSAA